MLIDVSATGRAAGFKYPVALTAAAWAKCVTVPVGVVCQDKAGRLWNALTMLRFAIPREQRRPRLVPPLSAFLSGSVSSRESESSA